MTTKPVSDVSNIRWSKGQLFSKPANGEQLKILRFSQNEICSFRVLPKYV